MLYEYLLTVEDELELIWNRRMSSASWIFFANRAMLGVLGTQLALRHSNVTVSTLVRFALSATGTDHFPVDVSPSSAFPRSGLRS